MQNGQSQKTDFSGLLSFAIVNLLFFFSGLSSLIYQVIWTRMLVFVFGSTTFATSTVLAVFMGGLALGAFLAGRIADKSERPFKWYGILEGFIGVWALLAPLLFSAAIPFYKLFFESLHSHFIFFGLLRFLVAAIILLPPTACMGATLPLLARFVTDNMQQVGNRVGGLYAINTFGAVCGAILGGFVLLPALGISSTTFIAAIINLLLAASVIILSKNGDERLQVSSDSVQESSSPVSITVVRAVMLAFGISGALAMIYEVAWTRSLLMVIGSTTYAFTIMLSTFLLGIFLGSFVCSKFVDKLQSPLLGFALVQILLCLAGLLAMGLFNYIPYLNIVLAIQAGKVPELSMLIRFLCAGFIMMPISLLLGATFPLAVKICSSDLSRIGQSIGVLYSVNTLGAIVGAFLAGFLVIPLLGAEKTLSTCFVINFLIGVVFLLSFCDLRKSIKFMVAFSTLAVVYFVSDAEFWDYRILAVAQTERHRKAVPPSFTKWKEYAIETIDFPFHKEGKVSDVAILTDKAGSSHTLFTNGHADASDSWDMENQSVLAAYPLLLKPQAKDVCVIGWGSGVTVGYALRFPIEKIICAEIEPVVIEASSFFHRANYVPEKDARTTIEPSDGRNYLLGTSKKFDVIISEPSNPWQSGVCNLFTKEYFQICKGQLKSGGIFTMWTQINEIQPKNLAQIFSALHSAFPYVYVLSSGTFDVNAIASTTPLKIDYDELARSFSDEKVRKALSRYKLTTPEEFLSRIMICPNGLAKAVEKATPNSDDMNHLEYEVSRTYEDVLFRQDNLAWLKQNSGGCWDFINWGNISEADKAAKMLKVATSCKNDADRALAWAQHSMQTWSNADALAFIAQIQISKKDYASARKSIEHGQLAFPKDERFTGLSGIIALRKADYLKAREQLQRALNINSANKDFRYFLAVTYSPIDFHELDGQFIGPPSTDAQKIVDLCATYIQDDQFSATRPKALWLLANAYRNLGKLSEAEEAVKELLKISPDVFVNWKLLGEIYLLQKSFHKAHFCFDRAWILSAPRCNKLCKEASMLLESSNQEKALRITQEVLQISPANDTAMSTLEKLCKKLNSARIYYDSILSDSTLLESRRSTGTVKNQNE